MGLFAILNNQMNTDEKSIIIGCIKGNRESQKRLYELYLPYVMSLGRRYLFDQSYLNDIVHEIYIKAFIQVRRSYDPSKGDFKPWLAKLAIRIIYDFNKKLNSVDIAEIRESDALIFNAEDAIYKLEKEDLFKIIEQMPSLLRCVFNMYVIDQLPHSEIAEMLNCTSAVSRKRLSRAREWLDNRYFNRKLDSPKAISNNV